MPEPTFPAIDLNSFDFTKPLLGVDVVEKVLPHRHEMMLLDGIVHVDKTQHTIIGFKNFGTTDFWVRGHFPQYAVLPGVLMVEASAQLTAFYMLHTAVLSPDRLFGLGGIEETRFRETVRPGERLILVGHGVRVSPRMTRFRTNGFVKRGDKYDLVFETTVLGVPLGKWEDLTGA
jgi:3-hydroxyacyl-[acyl-carrier-protein] dehydratase